MSYRESIVSNDNERRREHYRRLFALCRYAYTCEFVPYVGKHELELSPLKKDGLSSIINMIY